MTEGATAKIKPYSLLTLWNFRELFYFLVLRDLKVRYKQTAAGVLWTVLQPFITVIVFSFLFGTVAKVETNNTPYPIFIFTGLLFWDLFSRSTISTIDSIISNQNLIKKIYFPKLILPFASSTIALTDFFFAFCMLILLLVYFHFPPRALAVLIIPWAIMTTLLLSLGVGTFLATLNVKYRDVRFLTTYVLQALLFLTPVVYPLDTLEQKYQLLFLLNPLTGIMTTVRFGILGNANFHLSFFMISTVTSLIIFFLGTTYFKRREKYFADII